MWSGHLYQTNHLKPYLALHLLRRGHSLGSSVWGSPFDRLSEISHIQKIGWWPHRLNNPLFRTAGYYSGAFRVHSPGTLLSMLFQSLKITVSLRHLGVPLSTHPLPGLVRKENQTISAKKGVNLLAPLSRDGVALGVMSGSEYRLFPTAYHSATLSEVDGQKQEKIH